MADAEVFSDRSLAIVESSCRPFLTEIIADNLESAKTALTSLHRNTLRIASSFPHMNGVAEKV